MREQHELLHASLDRGGRALPLTLARPADEQLRGLDLDEMVRPSNPNPDPNPDPDPGPNPNPNPDPNPNPNSGAARRTVPAAAAPL